MANCIDLDDKDYLVECYSYPCYFEVGPTIKYSNRKKKRHNLESII